jgi:K+-dependent Na+/Ca+ exchanger-like protein
MTWLADKTFCGLWALLPYRDGGKISEKSSRRISRQIGCLLLLFGGGILLTALRLPGRTGATSTWAKTSATRAVSTGGRQEDFPWHPGALEQLSRDEAERVLEVLQRRLTANGSADAQENGTAATPVLFTESRQLTAAEPVCEQSRDCCDGMCKGAQEYREERILSDNFIFINPKHLKDTEKPRLKYEDTGLLIYHFCWYLFGIVYMFAALAIVCDEFFVPALECFVDEFEISMDVAGATFMAAGGSMPELVTSFISTFKGNTMGFSAIVGSAVFNVLFVIAVCALASSETLVLTWWPLARDCSCYLITLITVALVFNVFSPKEIQAWEAILLLCEYVAYCTFMKFNHRIHEWVAYQFAHKGSQVTPAETEAGRVSASMDDLETNPNFLKPSTFRKGIVHLLTQNRYLYETAGIAAVTQIAGDLEETFAKLDTNHDGKLSGDEIQALLVKLGVKHPDSASMRTAVRRINRTAEDEVSFEAFKRWYLASEARIEVEIQKVFIELDTNKTGMIEKEEIAELLRKLGHKPTDEEIDNVMRDLGETNFEGCNSAPKGSSSSSNQTMKPPTQTTLSSPASSSTPNELSPVPKPPPPESISLEQFEEWYRGSLFFRNKKQHQEFEEDAENGALSLDAPEDAGRTAMAWYIFTYPIVAMLYCTLPDVRSEKWQRNWKVAVLEFSLCLVWIAIFCLLLIECTQVVSNTIGIPEEVASITVLAAGTSIPDLLSSYIVARNGEGDMAVSSSIGSNIFDVTIGLPLPWLTYCIVKSVQHGEMRRVPLANSSIGFSLIVLIVMLAMVLTAIVMSGWRLTKWLGWAMLFFYGIFVAQDLMNQMPDREGTHEDGVFRGALNF